MYMTSAKNIYLLLARDVSTDSNDKMNSITKIIDRFNIDANKGDLKKQNLIWGESIIVIPASYAIASLWTLSEKIKNESVVKIRLSIIDPSGKNLGGPVQSLKLPAGKDRVSLNFNSQGMPITKEGKYFIKAQLEISDKVIGTAEYPYEVEVKWLQDAGK